MTTVGLNPGLAASVVLSGAGAGQVTIGPTLAGISWHVTAAAILVNGGVVTNVPTFLLYNGAAIPANLLDGSFTGMTDSTALDVDLTPGQVLTGVWTGGDPGVTATLSIGGTQTFPG